MNKISLRPEDLQVESFATLARPEHRRGTVHAAEASEEPTFPDSCRGTCIGETCDPGCGPITADTCLLTCPDC
jgi:hypothetical protein